MKIILLGLFLCLFLIVPSKVLAHAGIEKSTDTTVVYISQDPISPLVGETVNFTFVLAGRQDNTRLINTPINLNLIDTFYGDQSKDQTILKQNLVTDVNGAAEFSYRFTKENYFDIELAFKDTKGNDQLVGFLVQSRKPPAQGSFKLPIIVVVSVFILGLTGGYILKKKRLNLKP